MFKKAEELITNSIYNTESPNLVCKTEQLYVRFCGQTYNMAETAYIFTVLASMSM